MVDPLFIHLWTLSAAFVLMKVKTGFGTHICNYVLLFLYKSGMISTMNVIYHKYDHPTSCVLCYENTLKYFFNLNSEFFINWLFSFFWFCNEKLWIYFWKRLVDYEKLGLLSKKLKHSKNKTKKFYTQVFRHCYIEQMRKFSGKINKLCISSSSSKFSLFKLLFLVKVFGKEQVKNHSPVFFNAEPT